MWRIIKDFLSVDVGWTFLFPFAGFAILITLVPGQATWCLLAMCILFFGLYHYTEKVLDTEIRLLREILDMEIKLRREEENELSVVCEIQKRQGETVQHTGQGRTMPAWWV